MLNKTYLLHHRDEKFKKRYDYISERLKEENIDYEVIDSHHPDNINYNELMIGYETHPQIIIEQLFNMSYMNFSKKISVGSLSLVLKHMDCWKKLLENNFDYILVLEDDAEIPNNFSETINNIMSEVDSNNCELVMIGTTDGFVSPNINRNNLLHFNKFQKTRCTHAYIISKSCAKKMLDGFLNFNLPIDFKMNEVIQLTDIKVWWYEPGIKQKLFI